MAVVRLFHFSS